MCPYCTHEADDTCHRFHFDGFTYLICCACEKFAPAMDWLDMLKKYETVKDFALLAMEAKGHA